MYGRRYMAEILPIGRKTLFNQLILCMLVSRHNHFLKSYTFSMFHFIISNLHFSIAFDEYNHI